MQTFPARAMVFWLLAVAPQAAQEPVFRAGARLVEVTVTVRDGKGQAVAGLAAPDFTVLDGGKPRPITFFRFDGVTEARTEQEAPRAAGVFTNRVRSSAGAPANITALVLDSINTSPRGSMMARAQMMRYLKALAPETRVAIFHMGHELRILHDFTDDAAALRARLEKAVLGAPLEGISDFERSVKEAEQFIAMFADDPAAQAVAEQSKRIHLEAEMRANAAARRSRMERSLAALEGLGRHLAGIAGRKNVVWISGGFSMVSVLGAFGMGPRGGFDAYEEQVNQTAQRLAQDGVVLYIVDAQGLDGPANAAANFGTPPVRQRGRFEPRERFERQIDAERVNNDPHSTMQLMASVTGGRYLHDTNDLAAGFRHTVADLRGSYTLGFYASEEPDNKWHKLKVRVNGRRGVTVRHREGYLAEAAAPLPTEWDDGMWQAAVSNPLGSSLLPLTAERTGNPAGELVLTVTAGAGSLDFRPEGENLKAHLKIAFAEKTADGAARRQILDLPVSVPAAEWRNVPAPGVPFRRRWTPGPDATAVRVVVLDTHTGRYGTIDVPLGGMASAAEGDDPPRILFREAFEDTGFASRGWYDGKRAVTLSSAHHAPGGTKSFEIRFRPGDVSVPTPARHLFEETESVYISFKIKFSPNWMGSGKPYHPHFLHLMTNKNRASAGPASSYLTTYLEDLAGTPQLGIQDSQNITENTEGEDRAVAGCNGDWDGYGKGDCYKAGAGRRNGKFWRAKQRYFQEDPGPYYKGDWHYVEARFKLNSISPEGRANKDGLVQYWYDGAVVIDVRDAVLRTGKHPDMKFNQLLLTPYIGDGSPVDQTMWMDDLLVATAKPK
jgi:VWFA-related protein